MTNKMSATVSHLSCEVTELAGLEAVMAGYLKELGYGA